MGARFNRRITRVTVGRHLPYRTARTRLTLLYGGLFLVSGAALMATAYALLVNAGFVLTLPGTGAAGITGPTRAAHGRPVSAGPLSATHPSAATMAHWRGVARCMRRHGVSHFPDPRTTVPAGLHGIPGQLSDRGGAIIVIPATISMQSTAFQRAAGTCGWFDAYQRRLDAQANLRRSRAREQLEIRSGIALAAMSLLSLGLGWLMAGRVLRPLKDAFEAQRQFVANASHELRAPLTRLRAMTEVALASPDADEESLRMTHRRVLASEQHLETILDALLALARGRAGTERGERADLSRLAGDVLLAQEPRLAGLDLRTTLHPAVTAGDPRLLDRLITNLVDNAIRHNSPGGQLELATGTRDGHPFISIANTGQVIPAEQVERLFQPFERLDTRTGHGNGHGLGLSIVQAIADAHGAVLDAQARPTGGLAIAVSFPTARAGADMPAPGPIADLNEVQRPVSADLP